MRYLPAALCRLDGHKWVSMPAPAMLKSRQLGRATSGTDSHMPGGAAKVAEPSLQGEGAAHIDQQQQQQQQQPHTQEQQQGSGVEAEEQVCDWAFDCCQWCVPMVCANGVCLCCQWCVPMVCVTGHLIVANGVCGAGGI